MTRSCEEVKMRSKVEVLREVVKHGIFTRDQRTKERHIQMPLQRKSREHIPPFISGFTGCCLSSSEASSGVQKYSFEMIGFSICFFCLFLFFLLLLNLVVSCYSIVISHSGFDAFLHELDCVNRLCCPRLFVLSVSCSPIWWSFTDEQQLPLLFWPWKNEFIVKMLWKLAKETWFIPFCFRICMTRGKRWWWTFF